MLHTEGIFCAQNQSQLTLAESLCETCSYEVAKEVSPDTTSKRIDKAWRLSEFAIASSDPEAKNKSLCKAADLAIKAAAEKSHFATQNRALMLSGLMPALIDRAWRRPPQPESKHHANQGYGEVLVSRYYRGIIDNKGLAPEALVLYLLSREALEDSQEDDFYYTVSPREDNQRRKRKNHDIYRIWQLNGDLKSPVQLKSSNVRGGYDVPILSITAALKPVLTLLGDGSLDLIMNLAAFERLNKLSIRQEVFLDFATYCLSEALKDRVYIDVENAA